MSVVEIQTPMLNETIYLAQTAEEGKALVAAGVPRGRILSRKELETLKALRLDKEGVKAVLEAKLTFDARVEDVLKTKPAEGA